MIVLLVRYWIASSPGTAGTDGRPPTLMNTFSALSAWPATLISWAETKRAWPWSTVTFSACRSDRSTAVRLIPTTSSLRAFTRRQSTATPPPMLTPNSAARRARRAT